MKGRAAARSTRQRKTDPRATHTGLGRSALPVIQGIFEKNSTSFGRGILPTARPTT